MVYLKEGQNGPKDQGKELLPYGEESDLSSSAQKGLRSGRPCGITCKSQLACLSGEE